MIYLKGFCLKIFVAGVIIAHVAAFYSPKSTPTLNLNYLEFSVDKCRRRCLFKVSIGVNFLRFLGSSKK